MNTLTRRGLLGAGLATATLGLATPAASAHGRPGVAPLGRLAVRGGDISFLLQEEAAGARFRDRGRVRPVERILADHGANWVRLRIWTAPPAGYSTLQTTLELARRARRAGLKILLDPHYCDFWADPGKQPIPAGWPSDSVASLAAKVRSYTREVIHALARQGTPADMIQIGNEVTNGMLWPLGRLYQADGSHWAEFTTLVRAGIEGARAGNPAGHRLRTMVHLDRGGDNGTTRYFFDSLFAAGIDIDVIGQSYYAVWHGSLATLAANLNDTALRYGKDIVVAEVQYPWTVDNGDDLANFVGSADVLPDGAAYPPTPAGQAAFYQALRDVLAAVPNGRGAGFLVWEPEWIPGVGWEPGAGNPNDNMTLFDFDGDALPAIEALRPIPSSVPGR